MKKSFILVISLLFMVSGCSEDEKVAQKTTTIVPAKKIPLSTLNQFIGKYTYEGANFVEQEPLGSRLQKLLGDQYLQTVVDLQMRSPLYEQNGTLFMYAQSSHEDEEIHEEEEEIKHKKSPLHRHEVLLIIDVVKDNLYVNLSTHGIKREFNEKNLPIVLPTRPKE